MTAFHPGIKKLINVVEDVCFAKLFTRNHGLNREMQNIILHLSGLNWFELV